MKVHSIPYPIFWNHMIRFIQNLHHCSVSWKITPLQFLAQTLYTFDKKITLKKTFQTFELLGKNWLNSSCHIWNHKSVFFKLCVTIQCHERLLFCTFYAETLYDLNKKSPSKSKISDFWLLKWNFIKFVLW